MKQFMNEKNHVGTMRWDFTGGEHAICNQWFHAQELLEEETKEIQTKVNEFVFDRFNCLSRIVGECGGTSYNHETRLMPEETEHFIYGTKLIPVEKDYNGYVYVYRKGEVNG